MNIFYGSTAFTTISAFFKEREWGDTMGGGGGRREWILYKLDKCLLPPSRERDLPTRDQRMKRTRRRKRSGGLEEGEEEGVDDESREATLRHPSLGGTNFKVVKGQVFI